MNQQTSEQIAERGFALLQRMLAEEFVYLAPLIYAFEGKVDAQARCWNGSWKDRTCSMIAMKHTIGSSMQ